MKILLWLAIAGSLGTMLRWGLGGAVQKLFGGVFPWGTFTVNMAGCFLFGLVWSMAEERLVISGEFRAIILVGFMGAFTTFSSFVFESAQLMRESQWLYAFANIAMQNILGVVCLFFGFMLARSVL